MSKIDPQMTRIVLPDDIPWRVPDGAPANSVAEALLYGSEHEPGIYLVLMKRYPGYMSAPHHYRTDRICVVISGVWWCNSGADFDPAEAQPAYPGSYVYRRATTPHYDGARADADEPVVIAVTGVGPVDQVWVEPDLPTVRTIQISDLALPAGRHTAPGGRAVHHRGGGRYYAGVMATTLRAPRAEPLSRVPSPALVIGAIASVQFGAALAITIFDRVGASGTVMLRLISASLVLALLWRSQLRRLTLRQLGLPILFGVVLAVMNLSFYASIARIPLGIAVAIEFLGPLAVALGGSRRPLDLVWVAFAAAGVIALAHGSTHGLDVTGVMFAALAGLAWGAYILLNARLGRAFADGSGLAVAMCVAAILTLPLGIASGGAHLLEPHVLLIGGAVGILCSAIPYSLEMEALRRIRPEVFGVLMSIEPAVAALAGFLVIGQGLSARELVGIILVAAASAGSALQSHAPVAIDDAGIDPSAAPRG